MGHDDFLKGFLTSQERLRKMMEAYSPLDGLLEDEKKRRKLLSPLTGTARLLEESQKGYREQLSELLHSKDCLSDVLERSGQVWKSIDSTKSAFDKLTEQSEATRDTFKRLTEQFDANKESLSSIANNILLTHSFDTHLRLPQIETNLVSKFFTNHSLLTDAFQSLTIDSLNSFQAIDDFIAYTESSNEDEIQEYFTGLDEPTKIYIIWFIKNFVLNFIVGVLVYLLMESTYIQEHINKHPLSSESDVHEAICEIPAGIDLSCYSDHRVITGNNVNLRNNPSMDGEVLGVMQIGTLVRIIREVQSWTEIELYHKESDASLTGWVSSGYLTDLKR